MQPGRSINSARRQERCCLRFLLRPKAEMAPDPETPGLMGSPTNLQRTLRCGVPSRTHSKQYPQSFSYSCQTRICFGERKRESESHHFETHPHQRGHHTSQPGEQTQNSKACFTSGGWLCKGSGMSAYQLRQINSWSCEYSRRRWDEWIKCATGTTNQSLT
jgi:hypothetical protein